MSVGDNTRTCTGMCSQTAFQEDCVVGSIIQLMNYSTSSIGGQE